MNSQDKIIRSDGVTSAERYLKALCERSFLSMWSYAGIFNDKGKGQEVCDLLVVFGNHIIIFSDKDCEFPNTGDLELNWKRWYKKAIKKSADQVYGAERWISKHPDRLFLDQTCKNPFPISLPEPDKIKFHRIVVAHSASAKCAEILGGSGSLMIKTDVIGDSEIFTIGKVEETKNYIHVLDDTTLDILLNTLDTITDFVEYLEKKEEFLSGSTVIFSTGEEELLANYLKNIDKDDNHCFDFKQDLSQFNSAFLNDEGTWIEFSNNPVRKAQIQANKISYVWDALIETFAEHMLEGTSVDFWNLGLSVAQREPILRFMASENRTKRRMLAELLLTFIERTPKNQRATRTVKAFYPNESFYVFLLFPYEDYMNYEEYRKHRVALLEKYCLIAKLKFPEANHIVGIATESGRDETGSEDAVYLNASEWSNEDKKMAEKAQRELQESGLIGKYSEYIKSVNEYPYQTNQIRDFQNLKGRAKNLACPCGSGRKYKKCHGGT